MAELGFRILLVSSAAVLILALIDVAWLVRNSHAAGPTRRARRRAVRGRFDKKVLRSRVLP